MRWIRNDSRLFFPEGLAVTLGKFDGIHLGHQKLIQATQEKARQMALQTAVFTFDGLPESLCPLKQQQFLTLSEERKHIFEQMEIDILIEYPFTESFAQMEPEAFINEILVRRMRAKVVAVGEDYHFGRRRRGDVGMLEAMAPVYGYETVVVKKERFGERDISATFVREELGVGHMETVNMLLGRPFSLAGRVVHGSRLGSGWEIPTVNLLPAANKLLPPYGVYASEVVVEGRRLGGVSNLGIRPTVSNSDVVTLETFIFDFSQDLYDEEIEVRLKHFQRPEMKFANVEDLKKQLSSDVAYARAFCMKPGG